MQIGKTINQLRRSFKLKQKILAKACDITPSYLSRIENDPKIIPSIKTLEKLASNLGTTASIIIAMSITEEDIEHSQKVVFRILYPHVKNMLMQIVKGVLL